jgi:hypothetical protein
MQKVEALQSHLTDKQQLINRHTRYSKVHLLYTYKPYFTYFIAEVVWISNDFEYDR